VYTAFLLAAATCLASDGASGNPGTGSSYAGNPPGGSYGGLENGYDPATTAAWAPHTGGRGSPYGGGYGSGGERPRRLMRLGEWIHHRQDDAQPDRGNSGFSCGSCSFGDSPPLGWDGVPDLGAPVVAPTGQTSPAPAAAGDKK
jgi:hypothetical protein